MMMTVMVMVMVMMIDDDEDDDDDDDVDDDDDDDDMRLFLLRPWRVTDFVKLDNQTFLCGMEITAFLLGP